MSDHPTISKEAVGPLPDANPLPPRSFVVPAGAVDTHAHVIGHSFVAERSYTPPPASESAYLRMLDATGMTFGVLIQPSVHGTDNSLMLDVLQRNSKRLRGIAVAPHDLPSARWHRLKDCGVVGLRLNAVFGGGVGLQHLPEYEAICRDLGWHLQFLTKGEQLPGLVPLLENIRVPAVVDHMGHFRVDSGLTSPAATAMIRIVSNGGWVKLSGAFRLSGLGDYADTTPLARALIDAGGDRCVWGSDWPHVSFPGPMPNVGALLDLLCVWAPDAAQREKILTVNAQRLYGF
jgi:2-pyrone-4,6-dicarboxylate lactonase